MGDGSVAALLAWGEGHRRDWPWRRTRDPWAVLVSEFMLHQTQVARVVPRYEAFMRRWPTAAACAAAPVGEVVKAWTGLGYNRRAVRLHAVAAAVTDGFPRTVEGWQRLPGVGPYTARAVVAYADLGPAAVVEANVRRVLARRTGRPLGATEAQRRADAWLPAGRAWAWNSALMDLGQHVCRPRRPACRSCPIAPGCSYATEGGEDPGRPRSVQARFEGSDRQGRGRLVRALGTAPVRCAEAAAVMGWPDDPDRAERVWRGVVADGLAAVAGDTLTLP